MLHLPTKRYPISSNAIDYEINKVMAIGHGFEVGVVALDGNASEDSSCSQRAQQLTSRGKDTLAGAGSGMSGGSRDTGIVCTSIVKLRNGSPSESARHERRASSATI